MYDKVIKTIATVIAILALIILNGIYQSLQLSSNIGRYQLNVVQDGRDQIIDTKTGRVYYSERPRKELKIVEKN